MLGHMGVNLRIDPRKAHQFAHFQLRPSVLKLVNEKFVRPLPVQRKMLALNSSGCSIYAQSAPNLGKSTAAVLSLLSTARVPEPFITNLVLVPTPALVDQYVTMMHQFGGVSHIKRLYRTSSEEADEEQHEEITRDSIHTLIATPHRVLDYLSVQPELLQLNNLKQLVIDELDTFVPSTSTKKAPQPLELLVEHIYQNASGSIPITTLMSSSSSSFAKFSKLPDIIKSSGRALFDIIEPESKWEGVYHHSTNLDLSNEELCAQEVQSRWTGPGLVIVPPELSPLKLQTHLADNNLEAAVVVRPSEVAGLHIENLENIYSLGVQTKEDLERLKWMMTGPVKRLYVLE